MNIPKATMVINFLLIPANLDIPCYPSSMLPRQATLDGGGGGIYREYTKIDLVLDFFKNQSLTAGILAPFCIRNHYKVSSERARGIPMHTTVPGKGGAYRMRKIYRYTKADLVFGFTGNHYEMSITGPFKLSAACCPYVSVSS